jgi:hypothetical protein
MADDLRARLIAADGFNDTLAALRAHRTQLVVAEWLDAEADRLDPYGNCDSDTGYIVGHLRHLADSLTQKGTEP